MPVTPEEFVARVRRRVAAELRDWALGDTSTALLDVPLLPPSERRAMDDLDGTLQWLESWRRASGRLPITVSWASRAWARVGRQDVPERVRAEGPDALVALVGETERWRRWTSRVSALRERLGSGIDGSLRRHLRDIGELDDTDFERLASAVDWLAAHPESGLRVRELPIRGIDTKWLGRHRAIVESLTLVVTGRDSLGLRESTEVARIRLLDPAEHIGGLRDLAAPIPDLAELALRPRVVLIVENLQTFLSLPAMPGVLAMDGRGDAVVGLTRLPWLRAARVLYWGDIDSHGFRILNRARSAGLAAESVLMDTRTLVDHRDLWVVEPKPFSGVTGQLTEAEEAVMAELRAHGHVRLEQERIPWVFALDALGAALLRPLG